MSTYELVFHPQMPRMPNEETAFIKQQISNLPDSVQSAIHDLPQSLKEAIFPQIEPPDTTNPFELHPERQRNIESIIAILDEKSREEFFTICAANLFNRCRFSQHFQEYTHEIAFKHEVIRFMDILWNNRGKRSQDLTLFQESYYTDALSARKVQTDQINIKETERRKLLQSIEDTRKQVRMTERKTEQLRQVDGELALLRKQQETFDQQHENLEFQRWQSHGIEARQQDERAWTESLVICSEYLDPSEFATIMSEHFQLFFASAISDAKEPDKSLFGQPLPPKRLARSKLVSNALSFYADEWYAKHAEDSVHKKPVSAKDASRQQKVIEHFRELCRSYLNEKADKKNDHDLRFTIKQMEAVLTVLKKIFNKSA